MILETTREILKISLFCTAQGSMDNHLTTNTILWGKNPTVQQPTEPFPHQHIPQPCSPFPPQPQAANKAPSIPIFPVAIIWFPHNMVSHWQQFCYFGGQAFSKAMASQQRLQHGRLQHLRAHHEPPHTSQASGCVSNFVQRACFVDHLAVNNACLCMWTWHNPVSGIVPCYTQ